MNVQQMVGELTQEETAALLTEYANQLPFEVLKSALEEAIDTDGREALGEAWLNDQAEG